MQDDFWGERGFFGWGGGDWNRRGAGIGVIECATSNYRIFAYVVSGRRFDRPGRAAWSECGCRREGSIWGTNRGVERTGFGVVGAETQ